MKFLHFTLILLYICYVTNSVIQNFRDFHLKEDLELLKRKENFLFLPTPLHRLNKISQIYNKYNIYIKRDDMTGLAFGGNKSRKLEYIIHHAIKNGVKVLITYGSPQSNHARQTAAACSLMNIDCYLILVHHKDNPSRKIGGNLLLDHLLGAKVIITYSKEEAKEKLKNLKQKLNNENKKFYFVPIGGSDAQGLLGYMNAFKEILEQEKALGVKFDYIIHASASLATQVGLILGKKIFKQNHKIIGVSVTKHQMDLQVDRLTKINILLAKFNKEYNKKYSVTKDDFVVDERFRNAYEKMDKNEHRAIDLFAKNEAIILDPVYTGRAAGGMLHMLENKEIPENSNILFIHTGGTPLIFSDIYKLKNKTK